MKRIRISALILLIQTILWIILMAISTSEIEVAWEAADYLVWSAEGGIAYALNYINVSLLTILVVIFYAFLHQFLTDVSTDWSLTALAFVPIYGAINLLAYSIQVTLVPRLAEMALASGQDIFLVAELIQANQQSMVGYANGLAYALLGIPSIIYGVFLVRKAMNIAGWLLLINGIACILGIVGYIIGSSILGAGTLLGGVFFLLALGAMVWEFR